MACILCLVTCKWQQRVKQVLHACSRWPTRSLTVGVHSLVSWSSFVDADIMACSLPQASWYHSTNLLCKLCHGCKALLGSVSNAQSFDQSAADHHALSAPVHQLLGLQQIDLLTHLRTAVGCTVDGVWPELTEKLLPKAMAITQEWALTCLGPETPKPTAIEVSVASCSCCMRPCTLSSIESLEPVTPVHRHWRFAASRV